MAHQRHLVVIGFFLTSLFMAAPQAGTAGDDAEQPDTWQIHGRVVDAAGKPVDDFVAATFWSSNGKQWNEKGEFLHLQGSKHLDQFWKEEGVLEPFPNALAKRLTDGEFVATVNDRPRVSVFVTDRQQQRGGFVSVEKTAADKHVNVTLLPLVRVTGEIYCPQAGRTPDWTVAIVHPVGDEENYLHFTHCGSLKGKFSLLLPPGKYDFQVHSDSPDATMHSKDRPPDMPSYASVRVEVPANKPTLELGVLNVEIPAGQGDYSSYYGKEPPALDVTDARGISKDVKLADLRGKWVLLDFWSLGCGPCLHTSLPDLTKLYEEHAVDRSRFEILSICVGKRAKIKTLADFEAIEKPIVNSAWYGKPLPFPVLIDGDDKTSDAYGVGKYPTILLINPEGHLVKWGDEVMLVEKLKQSPP